MGETIGIVVELTPGDLAAVLGLGGDFHKGDLIRVEVGVAGKDLRDGHLLRSSSGVFRRPGLPHSNQLRREGGGGTGHAAIMRRPRSRGKCGPRTSGGSWLPRATRRCGALR
ncbi:MAG: hypothetical protein BWY79_00947 [Actinobacteria bacterium ADurb.Bin444]|nr:MAG: hypothetical protein BWY79_00947 [Actinobacteria bacterium ADurb.Bin444]